jgi:hypothetical protein
MQHLPWLVVHGALAFRLALGAATLAGLAFAWLAARARSLWQARKAKRALGDPSDTARLEEGATVTVVGVIEAAETLAVLTEDARFELAFAVEGSIASGEQVRVRGVLRREPNTFRSATYRDTRTRWILGAPLSLASEGRPRVTGPSWPLLCRGAGTGALLFVAAASLAGEIATRIAVSPGAPDRAAKAALLAAASPLHRERALAILGGALSLRCLEDYSRDHFEQEVAFAELQGDCERGAGALLRHGQLERAADVAERCGTARIAARAHYLRGRFTLASQALERARLGSRADRPPGEAYSDAIFGVRVHIFAGRFELAADEARRAAEAALRIDDAAMRGRLAKQRSQILTCVAGALSAQEDAGAVIAEPHADAKRATLCGQLLADAGRAEVRCPSVGSGDALGWSLCFEARLAPPDEAFVKEQCTGTGLADPRILDHPSRLFGQIGDLDEVGPPALAKRVLDGLAARPGPCVARGQLAAARAIFEAWGGEHREARRWAEQVVADFPRGSARGERAQLLRAAIELYAGDAAHARALLSGIPDTADDVRELRWMVDVRQKGDLALLSAPQERLGTILHDPQRLEPWSLTSQGDGARLAAWLQRHDAEGVGAYLLLGAPHLSRGREELLTWFRWGDKSECYQCTPALVLFDAASRASAVDLLGDRAMAGELGAIALGFHHAIFAREGAVPLAVIDAL